MLKLTYKLSYNKIISVADRHLSIIKLRFKVKNYYMSIFRAFLAFKSETLKNYTCINFIFKLLLFYVSHKAYMKGN